MIILLSREEEEISGGMERLNIPLGGWADMACKLESYSSCNPGWQIEALSKQMEFGDSREVPGEQPAEVQSVRRPLVCVGE